LLFFPSLLAVLFIFSVSQAPTLVLCACLLPYWRVLPIFVSQSKRFAFVRVLWSIFLSIKLLSFLAAEATLLSFFQAIALLELSFSLARFVPEPFSATFLLEISFWLFKPVGLGTVDPFFLFELLIFHQQFFSALLSAFLIRCVVILPFFPFLRFTSMFAVIFT